MSRIKGNSAHFMTIFEPNRISNWLMTYNWQQPDWPNFTYTLQEIDDVLLNFAEQTGHVSGVLNTLPESLQMEAIVDTMVAEAIKLLKLKVSTSAGRM